MIKKYSKVIPFIVPAIAFILGIIVGKPIEHKVMKYLEKKKINYELLHLYHKSIHDVQIYAEAEGISFFNVNLDDPFINVYHIIKVKLINEGININSSLNFNVTIDNQLVKILDVKHRVIEPENKNLLISHTIPALDWSLDKYDKSVWPLSMSWCPPQQNVDGSKLTDLAGYNIYGSANKDVGYGQINDKLLKGSSWNIKNDRYSFYKIQAVDFAGNRSNLSSAKPYPEILAFSSLFINVVLIEPDLKSDNKVACAKCQIYDSLANAIEEEGTQVTFLINRKRADVVSSHNLVDNRNYKTDVLYLDDLSFLNGKADIFMPLGLDENSQIYFYILYKMWPDAEHDISFNLIGHPDIQLVNKDDGSNHIISDKDKFNKCDTQKIDKKTLLTPSLVSTYLGKNIIYLMWHYPKDVLYKGVRIFRSEMSNANNLGVEVYDGLGETDKLKCITGTSKDKTQNKPSISVKNYIPSKPPPRKKPSSLNKKSNIDDVAPGPILNLKLTVVENVNEKNDETLPYFADTNVLSDLVYTYTLYAYDDKDNYSYPVIVNASLKEYSKTRSFESESKQLNE